jgi:hypothetical protein
MDETMIKNAGFMWHRKYVDWQRGAELIGYPERNARGGPVNFADQTAIYALYDHNYRCIYIGQAGRGETTGLYHRLKDHVNDYLFCMWERFSWYGFYSIEAISHQNYDKEFSLKTDVNRLMDTLESLAIHIQFPLFNRAMGSGPAEIPWYYQTEEYEEQQMFISSFTEALKRNKL